MEPTRKFSLKEARAAGLTLDQMRRQKLVVDKRRKSMKPTNVSYLESLGLPAQYSGPKPTPVARKTAKPPQKKSPAKPKPAKPTSAPKPKKVEKLTPKPKKVVKPAEKEVKPAKKPESKKKETPKPASKPEPAKVEKKPAPSTSISAPFNTDAIDVPVQKAVAQIFEATPLFGKKADLLEALEKNVASLTDMPSEKLLDKLKDENIITYSRSSPRGYSLS